MGGITMATMTTRNATTRHDLLSCLFRLHGTLNLPNLWGEAVSERRTSLLDVARVKLVFTFSKDKSNVHLLQCYKEGLRHWLGTDTA